MASETINNPKYVTLAYVIADEVGKILAERAAPPEDTFNSGIHSVNSGVPH